MSSPTQPSTLLARDGVALHVSHWPVPRPLGVVQFIHGLCAHAGRYADAAQALNDAGWAVVAIDLRGHGLSSGPRGALNQNDDLLHDQAVLFDVVAQAYATTASGLPHVLLGVNLGGLIAARLVAAQAMPNEAAAWVRGYDGAVLVAPALQPHMSFTQRVLLSAFGRLAPDVAVPVGFKPEWVSSDPQQVASMHRDPLIHDRITPRLTHFMHDAGEFVQQRAAHWQVPTLVLYSHADRIVLADSCERFAAAAPRALVSSCSFQTLAHDLLHEPERHQVHQAINQWLGTRYMVRPTQLKQTGS